MEQFHRLLGLDAEAAAEILAVVRKAVVDLSAAARSRLRSAVMSEPKPAKSTATDIGLLAVT